jgi:hypothetical protein
MVLGDAATRGVPVLPVGLRSGITGGLSCRGDEVAVDMSGLDRIVSIDETTLVVRAEAGVRGSSLEDAIGLRGLTVGHYPQSLDISSVGGWIATRSSGIASTGYGSIEHRLLGLRVALADGTLVETPSWPRASVGPDLTQPSSVRKEPSVSSVMRRSQSGGSRRRGASLRGRSRPFIPGSRRYGPRFKTGSDPLLLVFTTERKLNASHATVPELC